VVVRDVRNSDLLQYSADAIQEGLHERKVKREADKKKAQQS